MAQKSLMWTTGSTGDGASEYTQAEVIRWLRQMFIGDAADEGVCKNYQNELEVTGTASPVAVNTGAALVYGFPYWSTASENVTIPTPSAQTRIDRIVLRADWSAQTVRIYKIAGTEGAGAPNLTQSDGVIWDVPLAQVSITTGGVCTVTDERVFLHPNVEVETAMIKADAVTGAKIADDQIDSEHYVDGSIDLAHLSANCVDDTKAGDRVPQFYRRQGGSATDWSEVGTTTYTPTAVRMQGGAVQWTGSPASSGSVQVTFPTAFTYPPFVVVTPFDTLSANITPHVTNVWTTDFYISWESQSGTPSTVKFHWLAIGAE